MLFFGKLHFKAPKGIINVEKAAEVSFCSSLLRVVKNVIEFTQLVVVYSIASIQQVIISLSFPVVHLSMSVWINE
jgi:hypothetical protein